MAKVKSKKTSSKPKKSSTKKVNINAKKTSTKKPSTKSVKKASLTRKNSVSKQPTKKETKSKLFANKEVVINNKKIKLPKRVKLESYSCVWRMYLIVDSKTKEKYTKRFWIVIGDGHKKYRKFETQLEAIQYFRSLKKYAKMRVQSVKSKQFIRTIYTFFEMIWRGIEIKEIKLSKKNNKKSSSIVEEEDFEDEFTQFDTDEIDEEEFNEEEINKVLAEAEGDAVIVDDSQFIESKKQDEKTFITDVIEVEEKNPTEEEIKKFELKEEQKVEDDDPYALTTEVVFEEKVEDNDPEVDEPQTKTSLYELAVSEEAQTTNNAEEKNEINDTFDDSIIKDIDVNKDDLDITQHQTALTPMNESELSDGKYNKKAKIIYWLVVCLVALILAGVVVIALLSASGVIF